MSTTSRQITDLAELRTVIRKTRDIVITIRDSEGAYVTFARVSKKEAIHLAIDGSRLDDYAADLDESGYLYLNGTEMPNLRAERAPMRCAARRAALLKNKAIYESVGVALPDYMARELAALEQGTARVPAIAAA